MREMGVEMNKKRRLYKSLCHPPLTERHWTPAHLHIARLNIIIIKASKGTQVWVIDCAKVVHVVVEHAVALGTLAAGFDWGEDRGRVSS